MRPTRPLATARGRYSHLAGVAAVATAAAVLSVAAASASAAKPTYGVVPQDGAVPGADDLERMPKAGISSMRLLLHWGSVEPVPGVYNWGGIDATVRETTNRGIEPLFFLYGSPSWVTARDKRDCPPTDCSVYAPRSKGTRSAFARFARAAVERYGPGGDFWKVPNLVRGEASPLGLVGPPAPVCGLVPVPGCQPPPPDDPENPPPPPPPTEPPPPPPSPEPPPDQAPCGCTKASPLRVWQVWNEQNSPKYFAPRVDVKSYGKLLEATSKAIKAEDPGAEVMLGGMWGPQSATKVVLPLRNYLKRLYAIKGIEKSFDSIGVHPYAANERGSLQQLENVRRAAVRAGDRKVRMWVTELGWASSGPKKNPYVKGRKSQAKLLGKALGSFERKRGHLRLDGVYWYSWRDKPGGELICDWCGYAGLRDVDGTAKPAWKAFSRVAR